MAYVWFLLPALAPVAFWAGYHLYADRHLPEPPGLLVLAFVLGAVAFWLGIGMYTALDYVNLRFDAYVLAETNKPGLLAYAVLVIGVIEELAKMIPFLLVVLRFNHFNEPIDGVVYASFIALGFAAVENLYYLPYLEGWHVIARGFAGPVIHIVFASMWGYYIGRAWLCGRPIWPVTLGVLALTALLHGIYDFVVIALPASVLPVAAALIAGIWIWRLFLIRDLHTAPPGRSPTHGSATGDCGEPPD